MLWLAARLAAMTTAIKSNVLVSLIVAFGTAAATTGEWPILALWWYGREGALSASAGAADPIFGRPLAFYLFTLPAWQLINTGIGYAMVSLNLAQFDHSLIEQAIEFILRGLKT